MASFPEEPPSALEWRGIVEGFYGPPWAHAARLEQLRFAARHGMNAYVLAPKDDPAHRARWREPYPAAELARFAELAALAEASGIRFVGALAPGLDWRPGDEAALLAKAAALAGAGVRHLALLFDDLPGFTPDDARLGAEHGRIATALASSVAGPVLCCPADYAGSAATPYRSGLASTLPADALILWSGPSVVSAQVSAADVARAEAAFGRRLVLWDNVPVNDFDRARMFLGPVRGRPGASSLAGLLANPMVEPAASRITLATAAEYARDPAGYHPEHALARALAAEAEQDAAWLGPLAAAADWPPDADTGSALRPQVAAALAGDPAPLRARLTVLAARPDSPPRTDVGREVAPWHRAVHDMAAAGIAACDLLAGRAEPATVRAALAEAEAHWANGLRDVLSPFVRTALSRADADLANEEAGPVDAAGAPYALFVGAPVPSAGEERLIGLLRARGLAVRRAVDPAALPALVVVSRSADEAAALAAASLPVPLLALFHLVPLGLARAAGVLMREHRVVITAPAHPLAAGRTGAVEVHRGPAMARWCEPGPAATVVARAEEEPRPVIVHYPAGARLADGRPAPAARAALFLGRDLLAPWVITADGVALADAAIGALLDGV